MSYLSSTRLHFAGTFQANVSTVNNDPNHFNNATFLPEYQTLQQGPPQPDGLPLYPNGWFNPNGDGAWRLIGCKVTGAEMPAGVATNDPVRTSLVADSDSKVTAKLVDLDPEQQMVSEIWGLEVRITNTNGDTLMSGTYDVAPFTDIWSRAVGGGDGGDMAYGAMYQSVLMNLQWGDVSNSPFLTALQAASAASGLLSIKFNVDGINMNNTDPGFMCGRIVGTIGPASATEPRRFVLGRQFMGVSGTNSDAGAALNFCAAVLDAAAAAGATNQNLYLDLGNALFTTVPGGPIQDQGVISLSYTPAGTTTPVTLGTVDATTYTGPNWYTNTAGVVVITVTTAVGTALLGLPLTLSVTTPPAPPPAVDNNGNPTGLPKTPYVAAISEWADGTYVRADKFVFRMNPGTGEQDNIAPVNVWASQFGQPYTGQTVQVLFNPGQMGDTDGQPPPAQPPTNPPACLSYPATTAATDLNGYVSFNLTAADPGNPRVFIDGQVYGISLALTNTSGGFPDPANFISILIWSAFKADSPPTWFGSLRPIFQQYANLYPVMNRFLDMGDYESVAANAKHLIRAFGIDISNPNSMPVTRDLSESKRKAILAWLTKPGPDGKPLMGTPTPPASTTVASATLLAAPVTDKAQAPQVALMSIAPGATGPQPVHAKGGKTAAMAARSARMVRARMLGNS